MEKQYNIIIHYILPSSIPTIHLILSMPSIPLQLLFPPSDFTPFPYTHSSFPFIPFLFAFFLLPPLPFAPLLFFPFRLYPSSSFPPHNMIKSMREGSVRLVGGNMREAWGRLGKRMREVRDRSRKKINEAYNESGLKTAVWGRYECGSFKEDKGSLQEDKRNACNYLMADPIPSPTPPTLCLSVLMSVRLSVSISYLSFFFLFLSSLYPCFSLVSPLSSSSFSLPTPPSTSTSPSHYSLTSPRLLPLPLTLKQMVEL